MCFLTILWVTEALLTSLPLTLSGLTILGNKISKLGTPSFYSMLLLFCFSQVKGNNTEHCVLEYDIQGPKELVPITFY